VSEEKSNHTYIGLWVRRYLERVLKAASSLSSEHQSDHRDPYQRFTRLRQVLVVLAHPAVKTEPREGSFNGLITNDPN